MEERSYLVTHDKHPCNLNGQSGMLDVLRVEEVLPDGKKLTVHADFHFEAINSPSALRQIFQRLALRGSKEHRMERKVA